MRVISGEARGRPLVGPSGKRTRPTTDKVKGALFSILESMLASSHARSEPGDQVIEPGMVEIWAELRVVDLYAGTGALGIEALSRGAAWCDFVDADPSARRVIEMNLANTGLSGRARVVGLDARKVLGGAAGAVLRRPYHLVLMDPPYADASVEETVGRLASDTWLEAVALVAVEHSRRLTLSSVVEPAADVAGLSVGRRLVEARQRRHGDTVLSIYRWTTPGDRGEGSDGDDGDLSG